MPRKTDQTSKTEQAIQYIAQQGAARTPEIARASGIAPKDVSALLNPFVKIGLLITCKVEQPGRPPCNEYRLTAGASPHNWRNFRVRKIDPDPPRPRPQVRLPGRAGGQDTAQKATSPAQLPADQPQVSDNNSGSTPAARLSAAGRAVAPQPRGEGSSPPPRAAGHVEYALWSDGSLVISDQDEILQLKPADARRLAEFLADCFERLQRVAA